MNAMSNLTSIIDSVMKGSEVQLGDEDDLKARFTRLNLGTSGRSSSPRRSRRMGPRYIRITLGGYGEAQRLITQGPNNLYPGRHIQTTIGRGLVKKNFRI
ncbi:hypothetical protein A3K69_06910 [Candidatus Bathyarchaeota archaeon RBG_16_57_9]|nr:MAG: hypothetical protein A3K69_06910 [Candidatus Bathyarchaeota archaeon RBG_16_57_9]OGD54453.1 MAG: hypothetical protein A3K81_06260 [Candidatus Bathyarchaeota archaeon RBG_13_60_20]